MLRQLFSAVDAATTKRESEDNFDEARAANTSNGHIWEGVRPLLERTPFLSMTSDHDRTYNIGVDLLGRGFILEVTQGDLHRGDPLPHDGVPL